jgi:hypothetical protein
MNELSGSSGSGSDKCDWDGWRQECAPMITPALRKDGVVAAADRPDKW